MPKHSLLLLIPQPWQSPLVYIKRCFALFKVGLSMKGCSLPKPLLCWCISAEKALSHCSTSLHTGLKLSHAHEWKHENMWLPPAARPPHVTACADVSGEETTTPLSSLLGLPCYVPWHKSPFSCLASSVVSLRNLMLWVAVYYYQPVPTPKDSKTRTTQWILQFYIYNWTFIIFKISTRFITINYTLLSKYIKR